MIADVTIVVAIYNVEKYIDKCMNSLVNQTYKNICILAVSDGSQDGSMDIVEKYAAIDDRVIPVYKENGGYGSVLQYAEKNIISNYFLICDPDDWLASDAVDKLYNYAVNNNADIVISDRYDAYSGTRVLYKSVKPEWLSEISPNVLYKNKNETQKFAFFEVSPHGKLYKTTLLKGIKFPKKVSFTDYELYLLAIDKADNIIYCDNAYSFYYIDRVGNTYSDRRITRINDDLVVWNGILDNISIRHSDYNDICYLLQSMLLKLLTFFSEYELVRRQDINGIYKKKLFSSLEKLFRYKKNIFHYKWIEKNKLVKKLFLKMLLNKSSSKAAVVMYCLYIRVKCLCHKV